MSKIQRMHQIPDIDRPREKIAHKGVAALSNFELWEAYIGSGSGKTDVGTIARRLQRLLDSGGSDALTYEALLTIPGINAATACKIVAAFEIAKRQLAFDNTPLRAMRDILTHLERLRTRQQEHFVVLSLDGGQRLITQRTIAIGTLDAVMAHPREVFAGAVAERAASLIIAHNHPSNDTTPSTKDIELTQQLVAAGQLLGITLRDHIIMSRTGYYSFHQHHLL
jgi:DNA repair protein RadC